MTVLGFILILLGAVISIIVTYVIVKLAVLSAITEAQRTSTPPSGLDRIIKRAILDAMEESNASQQEMLYRAVKNAIEDAAKNTQTEGSAT